MKRPLCLCPFTTSKLRPSCLKRLYFFFFFITGLARKAQRNKDSWKIKEKCAGGYPKCAIYSDVAGRHCTGAQEKGTQRVTCLLDRARRLRLFSFLYITDERHAQQRDEQSCVEQVDHVSLLEIYEIKPFYLEAMNEMRKISAAAAMHTTAAPEELAEEETMMMS